MSLKIISAGASSAANGNGRLQESVDGGVNWSLLTTPIDSTASANGFMDVAHGDGMWVAVDGHVSATGVQKIVTSVDGATWTARSSPVDGSTWLAQDVIWVEELGLFVLVGVVGSASLIMTSPDGITWTQRTITDIGQLNCVGWNGSILVVGALNGVHSTSPDGITWTNRTANGDWSRWNDICWSPELALWVAAGKGVGNNTKSQTSTDGITWTARTSVGSPGEGTPSAQTIAVGWNGSLFVMLGSETSWRIATSTTGTSWTGRTSNLANNTQLFDGAVIWDTSESLWVVGCSPSTGNNMVTSPDGITWTARTDQQAWVMGMALEIPVTVFPNEANQTAIGYIYENISATLEASPDAQGYIYENIVVDTVSHWGRRLKKV